MSKVSVIMAAYNVAPYVGAAIKSILNQTYSDFELIVIDDGSTDETPRITEQFRDARIVSLLNEVNVGAAASRTRGLEAARGDYIAIADADDISLPDRLQKQVIFLDEHPEVGVLGAQYRSINARGKFTSEASRLPVSHNLIAWGLFTGYPIAHPTNMFRAAILEHYRADLRAAEDYELWMRLLWKTRFANLPDVLVHHRHRPQSLSHTLTAMQINNVMGTFSQCASELLGRPVPGEMHLHANSDYLKNHLLDVEQAQKAIEFLVELYQALLDKLLLDPDHLEEVRSNLAQRAALIARQSPRMAELFTQFVRAHTPLRLRRLWGQAKPFIRR